MSYRQARNYTVKYKEKGIEGLQNRRDRYKSESEMSELEKLRVETRALRAKKTCGNGGSLSKKTCRDRKEVGLSIIWHESIYLAIKEINEQCHYPIL